MSRTNVCGLRNFFRETLHSLLHRTSMPRTASSFRTYSVMALVIPSKTFLKNFSCNITFNTYALTTRHFNSCTRCIKQITSSANQKAKVLQFLSARHCQSIAVQRVRRASQIVVLYKNLGYDRYYLYSFFEKLLRAFCKKNPSSGFSLLLGAALFAGNNDQISDSELDQVSNEFDVIKELKDRLNLEWEQIVNKDTVNIWRKTVPKSDLYLYKVSGSYKDISARAFFSTQVDLEFRKQWDKHVISLNIIGRDESTGTEVVHWITQFPYPMSSREYVYVRRHKVDAEKRLMVIVSRGIDGHPSVPSTSEHVRVTDYSSKMIIRPHNNFDENGFDYVLTYFDDPKSSIPKVAQSWAANSGIPDFVDKLHDAAVLLQQQKRKLNTAEVCFEHKLSENDEQSVIDDNKLPM